MKLGGVYWFELGYQLRRPWPWLTFGVLLVFAFLGTRVAIVPVTLPQDFILNSPFIIAAVTVFTCQPWLLLSPVVTGDAAARDVYYRLHPLLYSTPLTKFDYIGGRLLAALTVQALVLLSVQLGSLLAVYGPGASAEIVGPFRPMAYVNAYVFIALTNVLIATTIQFAAALLSGRPMASYVGSLMLFFLSYPITFTMYFAFGERAMLLDPIGVFAIMNAMMSDWTIVEKNVRMFRLEGMMLWNRLLWVAVVLGLLPLVYARFRLEHRAAAEPLARLLRRLRALTGGRASAAAGATGVHGAPPRSTPAVRSFGAGARVRQTVAIAASSFAMMLRSPAGLFLVLLFPLFILFVMLQSSQHFGIPILPRTGFILSKHLTAPITQFSDFRVMVPLLIIFFTGELVWRERDAGMAENVDAAPVPEWVLFVGKYLGLVLLLVSYLVVLMGLVMVGQRMLGFTDHQPMLFVTMLFGLQLPEYLLFSVLAMAIHVLANQKYMGLLLGLLAYMLIVFADIIGVDRAMFVYGAGAWWNYTDMLGFGPTLGPWLWFRLYWAAWALLIAVVVRLLWVRGVDSSLRTRLHLATRRRTRAATAGMAVAVAAILGLGGFIHYNTGILNAPVTGAELNALKAEYERRYGAYEAVPQPHRSATRLRIEIHPDRGSAEVRGSYTLTNPHEVAITTLHLEPAFNVRTQMRLDRPARIVVADTEVAHHIYELEQPLAPGESMTLDFEVQIGRRGFGDAGTAMHIVENGSHLTAAMLPSVGYQPMRELWSAADRSAQGLPRQVTLPPPGDIDPLAAANPRGTFETVIGTVAGQVAVAPGELRREWTEGDRRYFHYGSDVPIRGTEFFFSARYATFRENHNGVDLQVYLHPGHAHHAPRVLRSMRESLDYFSANFGRYPWSFLQVVEQRGNFLGAGVDGSGLITGGEGLFQLDPQGDGFDMIYEVMAHEMGHQWWGMQVTPAFREGGGVISEGLAWYSAMQLVKHEKGRESLRRLMAFMRHPNPWPQIRTGLPLLRAMDPWANYRKAPYAFHALSEYVGEERVNAALRTLVERKATSLATTLDMYRELQAVTPDSLKPLLADLFERDVYWTFDTNTVAATQLDDGSWEVTLEVEARKAVVDSAGVETEVPMGESVEIGIFAVAGPGEILGKPLYLGMHRIPSGVHTLTIRVPERPVRAGIDPYNLLDWEEGDNIEPVVVERSLPTPGGT